QIGVSPAVAEQARQYATGVSGELSGLHEQLAPAFDTPPCGRTNWGFAVGSDACPARSAARGRTRQSARHLPRRLIGGRRSAWCDRVALRADDAESGVRFPYPPPKGRRPAPA